MVQRLGELSFSQGCRRSNVGDGGLQRAFQLPLDRWGERLTGGSSVVERETYQGADHALAEAGEPPHLAAIPFGLGAPQFSPQVDEFLDLVGMAPYEPVRQPSSHRGFGQASNGLGQNSVA
jgi:hypothetical protein